MFTATPYFRYFLMIVLTLLMALSFMLFPFLVSSEDSETANLGYSYAFIFSISSLSLFNLLKKEFKK
jgi:hypothetical protein